MKDVNLTLTDPSTREVLKVIVDEVKSIPFPSDKWQAIDIVFKGAVTNYRLPHQLGFIPLDVIQTRLTGAGTVTWSYDSFTRTSLAISTSGACRVRALVGSLTI